MKNIHTKSVCATKGLFFRISLYSILRAPVILLLDDNPSSCNISSGIVIVDHFGIVSYGGCIIRNILCYNTACANGHIAADLHMLYSANAGTDVGIVSNFCC